MEIVLASRNMHKIREIRSILKSLSQIDFISLLNFPDYEPPEETGTTFQENAELKAVDAARALGKWVMADDSGLVVPALGGEPGVYSRRYSGEDATDRDNNKKLLEKMQGLKGVERSAYYECSVCLVDPVGEKKTVTGICEGHILEQEKGGNGFGYDPLFAKLEYDKSFAELNETTKNMISHRRKALDKIYIYLESLVTKQMPMSQD